MLTSRVHSLVLRQIVRSMELLAARLAAKLLVLLVLPRVPQPIVLPHKLAPAMVARVRLYGLVGIHVRDKVRLPDESARALRALERFAGPAGVRPTVLLQIPLGGETFGANGAAVLLLHIAVRLHVRLDAGRQISRMANGTIDGLVFDECVLVGVRQSNVSG